MVAIAVVVALALAVGAALIVRGSAGSTEDVEPAMTQASNDSLVADTRVEDDGAGDAGAGDADVAPSESTLDPIADDKADVGTDSAAEFAEAGPIQPVEVEQTEVIDAPVADDAADVDVIDAPAEVLPDAEPGESNDDAAAEPVTDDAELVDDGAVAEPVAEVAESRAVIRSGQIYLEGAVPSRAAADEIVALAAEILGPDNVFDDYVIDPRAGDPSLGNITVEDTINFATGSAVLLPSSEGLLNQGLALMTIRPAVTIEIVGHTDDRGSDEYNLELSQQRADAVRQWFVDRGIDPDRLFTRGAGESEPIADNDTAEGRALNRRIQFFLQNILG